LPRCTEGPWHELRTPPFTGAGVTLGAVVINQFQLAGVAFVLLLLGALLVRYTWRRGKTPADL
jgi:hypothetical protein